MKFKQKFARIILGTMGVLLIVSLIIVAPWSILVGLSWFVLWKLADWSIGKD